MNSSSMPSAACSSASNPSLRAVFENPMMVLIVSAGSDTGGSLIVKTIAFIPAIKSGNFCEPIVAATDPPIVMINDGRSMNGPIAEPPEIIPNMNIPNPSTRPSKDAISKLIHRPLLQIFIQIIELKYSILSLVNHIYLNLTKFCLSCLLFTVKFCKILLKK